MPKYTANYNLIKPEYEEIADIAVINENMDTIDGKLKGNADAIANLAGTGRTTETVKGNADTLATHKTDTVHIPYVVVTGSSNTYAATLNPVPAAYTEGMALAIKVNLDNTGISTININGLGAKPIKKANGNDVAAGNLKAGSIYTLRYNGVNFILQGEGGSGNATASDLLSGKTASTDAGDIVGTMPNQGAKIITPGTTNQTIPAGYHDGDGYVVGDSDLVSANIKAGKEIFGVSGDSNVVDTSPGTVVAGDILAGKIAFSDGAQITGSMVNRGAYNITPGTTNKAIPAGYHNGAGIVYGDADLVAGNIKSGVNIFGVNGSLVSGASIKSVQRLNGSMGGSVKTQTLTISSVNPANTIIRCWPMRSTSGDKVSRSDVYCPRVEIKNNTQILVTREAYGDTLWYDIEIIEIEGATIQRGVGVKFFDPVSGSAYIEISPVVVERSVVFFTYSTTISGSTELGVVYMANFHDSTKIKFPYNDVNDIISWQVITF